MGWFFLPWGGELLPEIDGYWWQGSYHLLVCTSSAKGVFFRTGRGQVNRRGDPCLVGKISLVLLFVCLYIGLVRI